MMVTIKLSTTSRVLAQSKLETGLNMREIRTILLFASPFSSPTMCPLPSTSLDCCSHTAVAPEKKELSTRRSDDRMPNRMFAVNCFKITQMDFVSARIFQCGHF
ncbi:uncharacterized protein LOC125499828 [Athalia rosae]|uniref:uncharacterized protein LOC125499828 n=1 Tax=Athalia rosae TaxID=37344 RepID=UPI0020340CB1|nr:uncharacterized protein LOC125499828 [Athalia rosae]